MSLQNIVVKKMCGFYASNTHLATMLFPYLNKQMQSGVKIETIFEKGIEENVNELMNNLSINPNLKNNLASINWKSNKDIKYSKFNEKMNKTLQENNKITLLINGTNETINKTNELFETWLNNNKSKIEEKNINLINLYEITQCTNVKSILDNYDYVVNTSGEHPISELLSK